MELGYDDYTRTIIDIKNRHTEIRVITGAPAKLIFQCFEMLIVAARARGLDLRLLALNAHII